MVTVPANQGRRRVEVSLFDIFGPARTVRRSKPKKPTSAAADSTPAATPAPAVTAAPAPAAAAGAPVQPQGRAPPRASGRVPARGPGRAPGPLPAGPPQPPPAASATVPVIAKASDTNAASDWTAEQDAQLLELKVKNTSWKDISEAIQGKGGIHGLKERFKELNKDRNDKSKDGETGAETPKEDKGKKGEDGKDKKGEDGKDKKGEDGKGEESSEGKVSNEGKGNGKWKGVEVEKGENGEKEKNVKGKGKEKQEKTKDKSEEHIVYIDEDDDVTVRELVYMFNLAQRYEQEKWVKVASRFFDKTGKRLDPAWIAEKLGGG